MVGLDTGFRRAAIRTLAPALDRSHLLSDGPRGRGNYKVRSAMTPDERNLLTRFLADLNARRGVQKDAEAEQAISEALTSNPDAAYLLVQHAILADQALAAAQARIAELELEVRRQFAQGQSSQGDQGGGFLGGLFGRGEPNREPPPPPRRGPWGGPEPYSAVPQTYPQHGGFFGGGAPAQPGGMGSFLRTAGTTAAGIAGGAFLFQGLSNLFGGGRLGDGHGFLGGGGDDYGQRFTGGEQSGYGGAFDPGFSDGQTFADASPPVDDVSYDSDNGDLGGDDYS